MRVQPIALTVVCLVARAASMNAQASAVPSRVFNPSAQPISAPSFPLTATEAVAHVNHSRIEAWKSVSSFRAQFPEDSIRAVVANEARSQLVALRGRGRTGVQADAYAELFVAAEQDDSAQAIINTRVAASDVPVSQKAFTYSLAVQLFADYHRPERLPIAERYLTRLEALGVGTVVRQFQARLALVRAYYDAFQYDDVVRHGSAIMALLPKVPYGYRRDMFSVYGTIIDAMMRIPNGSVLVAKMNATMNAILPAPEDSAKMGGWDGLTEMLNRDDFRMLLAGQAKIGQRGGPLYSNYWINTPDTGAHAVAVNDGKIRLLGFGSWSCGFCVSLGSSMQRIHNAFPGEVEAIFVTETIGTGWGNRVVTPEEQSLKLTDWIVNTLGLKIPIAMYRGRMIPDPDGAEGDMVADMSGRAEEKRYYPWIAKPTMYLLDGTGTIRRVFAGFSGRETEAQILAAVQHLRRERLAGKVAAPVASLGPQGL